MTVSRPSSRRLTPNTVRAVASCAVLAALAFGWSPALAQVGEPTQLLPGIGAEEDPAPSATDQGAPAAPLSSGSIEVDPLDAVGTDYAGSLDSGGGGLGAGMWRGTDRVKVVRLLPLLTPTTSPVLGDLTRRLLLSNAAAPAGQGGGGNLLALRARLLSDMGLAGEALGLLRQLPVEELDAATARQLTELAWRTGDLDGGCATALESLGRVEVDGFWQKAAIFCQLRAGQTTEAELGLDVLRELGDGDEPFYALADLLAGAATSEIPPLPLVTPLYLAMARAANVPLPKIAGTPPPLMQALVAESPQAPVEVRLAAAETAAAVGLLSPQTLVAGYTAEPEEPGLLDTALDLPDLGTTAATRAVLYQATVHASLPQQRARFIQRALSVGPLEDSYWAALPLYAPLLAEMPASPDLASFAPEAARHLCAAGYLREAGPWLASATQPAATPADLPGLQALAYLSGSGPAPLIEGLLPPPADMRGARLRAIFSALDESLPAASEGASASLSSAGAPAMPQQNLNLWLDLGDAAAKGRVGETVLLSLAGLAQTGLGAAEPQWLFRVVKSLQRVGLEADARRLAVEAAIANGL